MRVSTWFNVKRFVGAFVMFVALGAIIPSLADRFWPVSYWIEMHAVHVEDAPYGTAPRMSEDREIHHDFDGRYNAEVEVGRDTPPRGYTLFCKAEGGPFLYTPDNVTPEDMDLSWWVGNACKEGASNTTIIDMKLLPIGKYRVETCRTVSPLLFFSPRRVCATSNDFEIYDPKTRLS